MVNRIFTPLLTYAILLISICCSEDILVESDIRSLSLTYWHLKIANISACEEEEIELQNDQLTILNLNPKLLKCHQKLQASDIDSLVYLYSQYFNLKGTCSIESLKVSTLDTEFELCCDSEIPMISGPYIELEYERKFKGIHGFYVFIAVARSTKDEISVEGTSPTYTGPKGCGIAEDVIVSKIIGGKDAKQNSIPWMVILIIEEDGEFYECGGTLLSSQWVITAAHCLIGKNLKVEVGLGKHNRSERFEYGSVVIPAMTYIIHPKYNKRSILNDIALVRMDKDVKYSSYIRPICLPVVEGYAPEDGEKVTAAGWGLTDLKKETVPDILQTVNLKAWDLSRCKEAWTNRGVYIDLRDSQLCAYEDEKDTCLGDSGGPLTYLDGERNILVGITSYGYNCAEPDVPAVYTKVSSYLTWINSVMKYGGTKPRPK